MSLFLQMGLYFLLISNYELQVEGGKETQNQDDTKKIQINEAPNSADKGKVDEASKSDSTMHKEKDDSSGKYQENSSSESSSESHATKTTPKAGQVDEFKKVSSTNKNQKTLIKGKQSDGATEVLVGTATQTSNNDHKPGFVQRISSKLPFKKSGKPDKKIIAASNNGEVGGNVPDVKQNGKRKHSSTGSSSSESDISRNSKDGKTNTMKTPRGKKHKSTKGVKKGSGQSTESSSSSESSSPKQKTNTVNSKTGDVPGKKVGTFLGKETGKDKVVPQQDSSSSETSSVGKKENKKKPAKVDVQKTKSSQNIKTEMVVNDEKDSSDNDAHNQQAVDADQPQGEKKSLMSKFVHRPHLPGPNIGQMFSYNKAKQQHS